MNAEFPTTPGSLYRALAVKIALLALVFLIVPIVTYRALEIADERQQKFVERVAAERGELIAAILRPYLLSYEDMPPETLQLVLDDISADGTQVRILLRPRARSGSPEIHQVASGSAVRAGDIERRLLSLIGNGVLTRLASGCDRGSSFTLDYVSSPGEAEHVTSLTPVQDESECWIVATSQSANAILAGSDVRPLLQTATVRGALVAYLFMGVIAVWLLSDLWRNMSGFRTAAREISRQGIGQISFRDANTIPEMAGFAGDFDSLVDALRKSKDLLVQVSEVNAHALKAPVAVIVQAVERLKRAMPKGGERTRRSIELIEQSVDRLELLISTARDIEQAAADAIYPDAKPINLSSCLPQFLARYAKTLAEQDKCLAIAIEADVCAYATNEALETIVENLLENGASFTPTGGTISVALSKSCSGAQLSVTDEGPGVPEADLPQIFERYFSDRSREPRDEAGNGDGADRAHYGLGLWIVQRNVEGLGGTIVANNRIEGGLSVTVTLRAAAQALENRFLAAE